MKPSNRPPQTETIFPRLTSVSLSNKSMVATRFSADSSFPSDCTDSPLPTTAPSSIPIMPFGCRRKSAFERVSDRTSSKGINYTSSSNSFTHLQTTTIRLPSHEKDENGTQCYENEEDDDDGFFLICPGQRDNIDLPPRLNDVKGRTLPSSISPKTRPTSANRSSTIKPRLSLQPRLSRQPLFE